LDKNWIGVYISNSDNSILTNITVINSSISSLYLYSYGINLDYSNNSILSNMTINASERGLQFSNSFNNSVYNLKLNLNDYGIYFFESSNNSLYDINIPSSSVRDVHLINSLSNNFINATYNISKEYVSSGSSLFRKWYYKAHVMNYSNNSVDVSNASVIAYNISGAVTMNLSTDASGWTPVGHIIDYVNIDGIISYYSSYIIAANDNRTLWDSHNYNATNVTNNLNDSFYVDVDLTPPVLSGVAGL